MSSSLLDKLSDTNGHFQDVRAAVSRDLEILLNTRSEAARLVPTAFPQCRQSSLTFGIPDFSALSLSSPQARDRIRRLLEQAIMLHECRLTAVRVTLEPERQNNNVLAFRVEALLKLGKTHEKVQFDAVLQPQSQAYQVV